MKLLLPLLCTLGASAFFPPSYADPPKSFSADAFQSSPAALVPAAATPAPRTHVMWKCVDGRISFWTVGDDGSVVSKEYGPFAGWTATSLADGADGVTTLIWTHTSDGKISLWKLDSAGNPLSTEYGPFSGWSAVALSRSAPGTGAPTGAASGDLFGFYPNPTIAPNAVDHTKLASDPASLAQVSASLLYNTDGTNVQVKNDLYIRGNHLFLTGSGGGAGNNKGRGLALSDGGPVSGLIINDGKDFGFVSIDSTTYVHGDVNANGDLISQGVVTAKSLQLVSGSDLAEPYKIAASDDVQPLPGMVVAIDPGQTGQMRVSNHAYDTTVGGIISGAGGVHPGITLRQAGTVADGTLPIACTGRVWCWCDAGDGGAITPGDLLTTSDTPGHAMRVRDYDRARGAIIGKAMSPLKSGKGLVLVLVTLQ